VPEQVIAWGTIFGVTYVFYCHCTFALFCGQDISSDAVADFQSDGTGEMPVPTFLPKVPVSNLLHLILFTDKLCEVD